MNAPLWTPEAVTTLLWMDAGGCSNAEIASALGTTRSAVAGRRFRMGLGVGRNFAPKINKMPKPKAQVNSGSLAVSLQHAEPASPSPPPPPPCSGEGVHLLDLVDAHCRWPIGHMMFCGAPKEFGPYCGPHAARAYNTKGGK